MAVCVAGDDEVAALYCSTSDWAFGPIFSSRGHAEDFLEWLRPYDARSFSESELRDKQYEWRKARCDEDGDLIEIVAEVEDDA